MTAEAASKEESRQLTIIITTSPTPSAPSTQLLSAVLASFRTHCPLLLQCAVIVVFDHYDQVVETARLKKGQVTSNQAEAYTSYKENVRTLIENTFCATAEQDDSSASTTTQVQVEFGSPVDKHKTNAIAVEITSTSKQRVSFIEPPKRLGFGLAVRTALRHATTAYVWVHQHDWTLQTQIPITNIMQVMRASSLDHAVPVKYVCLPSCRMLDYPISNHVTKFPTLNALTHELRRDYSVPSGAVVPLTPLFFWHDKPHIAERAHYLATVFPSRLAIARGAFIEDSIGQRARDQMKEGQWRKWACWLLYPEPLESPYVRHINGRTWRGAEATRALIERKRGVSWQGGGKNRTANRDAPVEDIDSHLGFENE